MNSEEFAVLNARRNSSLITLVWPKVKSLLQSGLTPKEVASQMAAEGYWGRASNRIGVADIYDIWRLAIMDGESEMAFASSDRNETNPY